MEKTEPKLFKALVFGATGNTGKVLVKELLSSPKWEQVSVVVRRKLDQWDLLSEEEKKKLNVIICEDFDQLSDASKWKFADYHSAFCCFGTLLQKYGKEVFYKVDHDYTIALANIARVNQISHLGIITSMGADSKSWFYYGKVKGQTEDAIRDMNFPFLSIFRPGCILGPYNERTSQQKAYSFIPFAPKISTTNLARAMRISAELRLQNTSEDVKKLNLKKHGSESSTCYIYGNSDANNLADMKL